MRNYILTIVVLILGGVIFFIINNSDRNEYIEKLKSEDYIGIVDSTFLDPASRMQPKAVLNNGMKVSVQNDIYSTVRPGDVLLKNAGSLEYYLIHKDDTIVYYQEYGGEQIKK